VSFHRPLVWVKLVLRCTMGLRIAPLIFFWFCSHYHSLIVMWLNTFVLQTPPTILFYSNSTL
jgi:hypothetical protein